jgi:hypothetical protein
MTVLRGHFHALSLSLISLSFQTLEHCIATFLDGCDVNDDHQITLKVRYAQ